MRRSEAKQMSEEQRSLDKFGRFVMEHLRDPALECSDRLTAPIRKARRLEALQVELADLSESQRAIVRRCVARCIDTAIHDFLFKLQERADFENDIQVFVDGRNVVKLSDGIHGEPYSEDGWQARFSRYGQGPDRA
jgi:hypothetical protein